MDTRSSIPAALGSGAIIGLLILGVGGLLAGYALAAMYGVSSGPMTLRRILEPVILGTVVGGLFALPLPWLHGRFPERRMPRALTLGVTPFVVSLVLMFLRRPPASFTWPLIITPAVVLIFFLIYACLSDQLYTCWTKRKQTP